MKIAKIHRNEIQLNCIETKILKGENQKTINNNSESNCNTDEISK